MNGPIKTFMLKSALPCLLVLIIWERKRKCERERAEWIREMYWMKRNEESQKDVSKLWQKIGEGKEKHTDVGKKVKLFTQTAILSP